MIPHDTHSKSQVQNCVWFVTDMKLHGSRKPCENPGFSYPAGDHSGFSTRLVGCFLSWPWKNHSKSPSKGYRFCAQAEFGCQICTNLILILYVEIGLEMIDLWQSVMSVAKLAFFNSWNCSFVRHENLGQHRWCRRIWNPCIAIAVLVGFHM